MNRVYQCQGRRKVQKSGAPFDDGHNLPPFVEIGLTDLRKSGGAIAPTGTTGLGSTENSKKLANNSSAKDKSEEIPQLKKSFRKYFKVSEKDKSKVQCTLCGSCWIPQETSGIRNHLKTHHFNEFLNFNKGFEENNEREKKRSIEGACITVANFNNKKTKKLSLHEKLVGNHGTSSDKPIGSTENFKVLSKNSSAKDKSKEISQTKQSFRKYFKVSEKDESKVECTLCGSCWIPQLKSGIRNHLKTQHFNEFLKFNNERKKKRTIENASNTAAKKISNNNKNSRLSTFARRAKARINHKIALYLPNQKWSNCRFVLLKAVCSTVQMKD